MKNKRLKIFLTLTSIITVLLSVILFIIGQYHVCDGSHCFICSLISTCFTLFSLLLLILICPIIKINTIKLCYKYNPKINDFNKLNNKISNKYYYFNNNTVDLNKICIKLQ